jgi:hypothetical protein
MEAESGKGLSILAASLILSACGGGGGGSATPLAWDGQGQEISYVYDPANKNITSIGTPTNTTGNYSTQLTFDAGVLTGLTLTTPSRTMSFASYEIFNVSPEIFGASNTTSNALVANHISLGWDYQTFGVWETGLDTTQGTFGAFSVGVTAGTAIPTTGSATFTGKVAGSYVPATPGPGYAVLANLTVNANFLNRSLVLHTTDTVTSPDWTTFTQNDGLNLSGNLSYSSGTNGFTGDLSTVSGLTGQSSGQFYGPTAQELGGVFFLQGGGETYTGAYGAKDTAAP